MQKYLKYILVGIIFCGLYSCQDMTKVYEEFEVPGGLKYPGQVMEPVYYSGHDRAKIEAASPVDPSVVEARVFWNYFKDSLSVNINPDDDLFVAELNNLPENDYAFVLRTYDNNGNISVPLELFGATYGENYMRRITNRTVENATLTDNGGLIISFDAAGTNGAFKSEVLYADTLGAMKGVSIIVTESTLIIDDFIGGGSEFSYRTAFRPDTLCLDTFYTEFDSHSRFYLDNTNWSIIDYSTAHGGDENKVENVIDGDPGTRWHTLWSADQFGYPHHVVIDLGAVKTISEIEIYRKNGDDRSADKIQLLIGTDSEIGLTLVCSISIDIRMDLNLILFRPNKQPAILNILVLKVPLGSMFSER